MPITDQVAIGLPSLPLDQISFFVRKDLSSCGKVVRKAISLITSTSNNQIFLKINEVKDRKKSDHNDRNCSILFRPHGLKPSKLSWKNLFEEGRFIVNAIVDIISRVLIGRVRQTSFDPLFGRRGKFYQ